MHYFLRRALAAAFSFLSIPKYVLGTMAMVAALCLAQVGQAAELDQDTQQQVVKLIAGQRYAEALALLRRYDVELTDNPDYNYLLGVTALKAGDTGLAQSALERVVLQKPQFAGAWLDLGLACEANGDLESAHTALATFLQRFATPPALRPVVAGLQERLDTAVRGKRKAHGEWGLSVGHDSNANNGFAAATLPLTIGGSVIDLPLDPSLQPRAAGFAETTLAVRGLVNGNEALGWYFSGRQRRYRGERGSDLGELAVGVTASQPLRHDWQARYDATFQNVQLGLRRLFNSMRVSAQLEHPVLQQCSAALGSEHEQRRSAPAEGIAANLYWVYTGLACQSGLLSGLQWSGLARAGTDAPADSRAGGQTQRQELFLQAGLPLLGRHWLEARWQWGRAADDDGYSSLIGNNVQRNINRTAWQFAFSTPLTAQMRGTVSLEGLRQRSNIPLFEQSNTTVKLGLRYLF